MALTSVPILTPDKLKLVINSLKRSPTRMKIACLQFAPRIGQVDNNLDTADAILAGSEDRNFDLLVLPELAFTGYNFKSAEEISPYLEPATTGLSSAWAKNAALVYDCTVICGYPEKSSSGSECYNTAAIVDGEGDVVGNYRKRHLYYTDDTWATEGPEAFYGKDLGRLGKTVLGICMDLNPYKFEAPWEAYEFANYALSYGAHLIVLSMAWNSLTDPIEFHQHPEEPDMETITYWLTRLMPLIDVNDKDEVIVVFANRTGWEDSATYVGTSTVVGIQDGEIRVYGMLGRGEKKLLVVDTNKPPFARLRFGPRPKTEDSEATDSGKAKDRSEASS